MLSVVSTPIGNLEDITLRAIRTLKECDAILCEDTRVTGRLLQALEIPKKELVSFHSHTKEDKIDAILKRLDAGEHFALVSDAGTPGISDPAYALVSQLPTANSQLQAIPGPAAFLAALSASGLPINQFTYLGFLPLKKGRKKLIESFRDEKRTIVFYESVHRIEKCLCELADALESDPDRPIVIGRELTKLHEEIVHTTAKDAKNTAKAITKKGEFVVIIGP